MRIEVASFVKSLNGRDRDKRFLVIEAQDEYSLIVDGKSRRIDKPKLKKNKHLMLEDKAGDPIAGKLIGGGKITNNEVRRALAQYARERGEEGGM